MLSTDPHRSTQPSTDAPHGTSLRARRRRERLRGRYAFWAARRDQAIGQLEAIAEELLNETDGSWPLPA